MKEINIILLIAIIVFDMIQFKIWKENAKNVKIRGIKIEDIHEYIVRLSNSRNNQIMWVMFQNKIIFLLKKYQVDNRWGIEIVKEILKEEDDLETWKKLLVDQDIRSIEFAEEKSTGISIDCKNDLNLVKNNLIKLFYLQICMENGNLIDLEYVV